MERKTIVEVIPNPSNAIITALNAFNVPWKNNNYYVPDDMDYVLNHASTKIISRMVNILLDNDGVLTNNALAILANVIFKMFSRKWEREYATFDLEYNPISNYDMIEQMEESTEREYGDSSTRTDNLSSSVTNNGTIENEIQGFNSNDYQPSEKQTTTQTGTQSNTGTQGVSREGTDNNARNYTLTRSGNIGVTTSQQMIESERKLWEYDFIMSVYRDIDKVMTIEYYGGDS